MSTEPLLVFPDPPPPELAQTLDLSGWQWKAASTVIEADELEPDSGWGGAVVVADTDEDHALTLCKHLRRADRPVEPLLLLISGSQLGALADRAELFDDFVLTPFHPAEFGARLTHALWRSGRGTRPELIEYGPLLLNVETYQASVSGEPLDLTYMEYELLKFLASSPGKVFTRETLLSQVWGYDYYGGARTVDVHVRRLRSKLGEEHAGLIQTIRSVGYSFGQR